jgi:hypothetical protein
MEDELAEINGIKPKVVIADGDEREVSSMTRSIVPSPDEGQAMAYFVINISAILSTRCFSDYPML